MKLDDIANLLADKINQAHYIKHYLNNVFIKGFEKGLENKDDFAIGFAEWKDKKCMYSGNDAATSKMKYYFRGMSDIQLKYPETYTTSELLEIYKQTL